MRLAGAACAVVAMVAGCGGEQEASGGGQRLVVSAATSLQGAFEAYGEGFDQADARFSFAGSDELAAQIRQGVMPDVYAAADTRLPVQLAEDGLVGEPVAFAVNRLVLAVPAQDARVEGVEDLVGEEVTIAVGAENVPVGSYTREVLGRLGDEDLAAGILANVRSEEPNVGGIVGKLTQGAVDAGFVYVTDVEAAGGALRAIELPEDVQPDVAYAIAVVEGASNPEAAQAFVDGLAAGGPGGEALVEAGFALPPGG